MLPNRPQYRSGAGPWRSGNRWYQWPILVGLVLSMPLLVFAVPYLVFRVLIEWTDEREMVAGAMRAARLESEARK
jgi:hypothetical protein